VVSWLLVVRDSSSMSMPGSRLSMAEGLMFTAQWGVMMTAMMLPSAAPMILLYRTVSRRLTAGGDRAVPATVFALVYLFLWLLTGIPVYAAYVAIGALTVERSAFATALPYALSIVLFISGVYQFSSAKRACLEKCESPLEFLMSRWRSGHVETLQLASKHAAYCIGCCWALMVVLVAVGAMSLPWVVTIAALVFAEKILPNAWRTARVVGIGLMALGIAVAIRPRLAATMRGHAPDAHAHMRMEMR
jgi:predicted metal-binding membrane protein